MDNKFDLYREVTMAVTSSLDIGLAMEKTFAVFHKYFPIVAISFHEYRADLGMARIYYLVTPEGFREMNVNVPLTPQGTASMREVRTPRRQIVMAGNQGEPVGTSISQAIKEYVPDVPRAHLVNILSIGDKILSHMSFLGTHRGCFTQEHCAMIEPLLAPLSLALSNLMQFKMNEDFCVKLGMQNTDLKAELDILKDNELVGSSHGLASVFNSIRQLSSRETPVLITGETGTGKDVVANMIQKMSPRRSRAFVKVNCGALPETLMDSELFGTEKGAYTGALHSRPGRFEQADGGTLFLDEIGELSLQAQVRLLRVLHNSEITRLGSTKSKPINVRIIAATNSNLEAKLQNGTFREDLYYRLNVFRIHVPPLRERKEDLIPLIMHFAKKVTKRFHIEKPQFDISSLEQIMAYSWPGNIRELENLVERALVLNPKGSIDLGPLLPKDASWYLSTDYGVNFLENLIDKRVVAILANCQLSQEQQPLVANANTSEAGNSVEQRTAEGFSCLDDVMIATIQETLNKCKGKISGPGGAAEMLHINPSTLRQRMRKFRIYTSKYK